MDLCCYCDRMARTPDAAVTQSIHNAALSLITTTGLTGLSMEKVASEAGVNKTTLYRRYNSVENLIADLIDAITTEAVPTPDTGTLRGDLEAIANVAAKVLDDSTSRTLAAILVTTGEPASVRQQWWSGRLDAITTIFEQAEARGESLPRLAPEPLLERLAGYLHLRTTMLRRPPDSKEVSTLIDELLELRGS